MKKSYSILLLSAATIFVSPAQALNEKLEMVLDTTDDVIVDVAPITPETPVDTGIVKDTVDLESETASSLTGSILSGSSVTVDDAISGTLIPEEYIPDTDNLECHNISCADMGYSQTSVADCAEYVRCPFDVSYRACVKYNDEYTLTSCPDGGICEGKFKITGCKDGYTMDSLTGSCIKNSSSCTPNDCSGYDLTSIPGNASYDTCTPGCGDTTPRYKLLSCNSGYKVAGTSCVACNCVKPNEDDYYTEYPSDCDIYGDYEGCNSQGMVEFDEAGYNKDLNTYNTCIAECK